MASIGKGLSAYQCRMQSLSPAAGPGVRHFQQVDQNHSASPSLYQVWMLLHVANPNVMQFRMSDFSTASLNEIHEILLPVDDIATHELLR